MLPSPKSSGTNNQTLPKRTTIHLIVSLTLLVSLFVAFPGVLLYRLARQTLTFPLDTKTAFPAQALKTYKQKNHLLKSNNLLDTVTYTQQELLAGCFEHVFRAGDRSILDPALEIHPSGITISATVYLFSVPVPRLLNTLLGHRLPVMNGRIRFYTRITANNRVIIEDGKPILRPRQVIFGKKEFPGELLFLARKILPRVFTKGLSDPIEKILLKEGEVVVYKATSSEPE